MKKILFAAAIALFATQASATIVGSSHDLTLAKWSATNVAGKSVCSYCHAAHVFNTGNIVNDYLWNRSINAASTAGVGAESKTCLSCHDGTTSIMAVNNGVSGGSTLLTGNMNIGGTDAALLNDHPVGLTYTTTNTSAGLAALATAKTNGARFFGAGTDQVECASCHDPHYKVAGSYKFTFAGFDCADCHAVK